MESWQDLYFFKQALSRAPASNIFFVQPSHLTSHRCPTLVRGVPAITRTCKFSHLCSFQSDLAKESSHLATQWCFPPPEVGGQTAIRHARLTRLFFCFRLFPCVVIIMALPKTDPHLVEKFLRLPSAVRGFFLVLLII